MQPVPDTNRRFAARKEHVLLAGIIGIFVCFDLGYASLGGFRYASLLSLDERLLRAFRDVDDPSLAFGSPAWVEIGRNLTALGSAIVLSLLALVVVGYLLLDRARASAMAVLAAWLGAYVLNTALKGAVARARPEIVPWFIEVHSQSFPSGHAAVSAAVYLSLAMLLARQRAAPQDKIYVFSAAFLLIVAIGVSRVFLGVHYPSDVLAGWTLGSVWALICWHAESFLHQRSSRPPREPNA